MSTYFFIAPKPPLSTLLPKKCRVMVSEKFGMIHVYCKLDKDTQLCLSKAPYSTFKSRAERH
jgi:hypothetical protein